jgi:hypothetical protein
MRVLHVSLAALATASVLIAAGLGACSTAPLVIWQCDAPLPDEKGVDGGPDPCHCDPPPPNDLGCECLHGTSEGALIYQLCMSRLPCSQNHKTCWMSCYEDENIPIDDCVTRCCPELADGGSEAGSEGGPLGGACGGDCVPFGPDEWTVPLLVWFGDESSAPACPSLAPDVVYEGRAGLDTSPASCGACSCDPPQGTCALPSSLTASAAACPGSGPYVTPFDPPPAWDGSCTTNDAVAAGKACGSFGVPCVQSVTTAPLVMTESGCTPQQQIVPHSGTITWSSFARACRGNGGGGTCTEPGGMCVPPASKGFRRCVQVAGDLECPSYTPYTEKHTFYGGADDSRDCSPCSCGAPAGSSCSATLTIYTDGMCSAPILSKQIDSAGPHCDDLVAGSALGSKSISPPTYTAGQCQSSGGDPTGSISPVMPSTFCCLP